MKYFLGLMNQCLVLMYQLIAINFVNVCMESLGHIAHGSLLRHISWLKIPLVEVYSYPLSCSCMQRLMVDITPLWEDDASHKVWKLPLVPFPHHGFIAMPFHGSILGVWSELQVQRNISRIMFSVGILLRVLLGVSLGTQCLVFCIDDLLCVVRITSKKVSFLILRERSPYRSNFLQIPLLVPSVRC